MALGLRGEHRSGSAVGETYQAVLHACPVSLFVVPPDAPVRLTPQILVIVTRERPMLALADWLVEQCLAQRLNVVFCASCAQDAKPADALLRGAGVRTQIVLRPGLFPEDISLLERERRVRWIAAPGEAIDDVASLPTDFLDNPVTISDPVVVTPPDSGDDADADDATDDDLTDPDSGDSTTTDPTATDSGSTDHPLGGPPGQTGDKPGQGSGKP